MGNTLHSPIPYAPNSGRLLPGETSLPQAAFDHSYAQISKHHPFYPTYINMLNPYTKEPIRSREDYELYLREWAFCVACENHYKKITEEDISRVSSELKKQYSTNLKSEIVAAECRGFNRRSTEFANLQSKTMRRISRARKFVVCAFVLMCAIALGVFLHFSNQKDEYYAIGYAAGQQDHTATVAPDTYLEGYNSGYVDGRKDAKSYGESYASHSSVTRENPAPEYDSAVIGNKNSKKYHDPDCGTLPSSKNQVPFDSPAEAERAGYVACARCVG